jgi:hypothetical protein
MKLKITYLSGDIETYHTTYLPQHYGAGALAENNYLHFENWEEKGIRLTRSYLPEITQGEDAVPTLETIQAEAVLVAKEELDAVELVTLDGGILLIRAGGVLMNKGEYALWLEMQKEANKKSNDSAEEQDPREAEETET